VRFKISSSLVCVIILFSIPCYGEGRQEYNNTRISDVQVPVSSQEIAPLGNLTFTGVSGKLSSREDSIQAALKDAARRLSFFYSVSGYSVSQEQSGGGTFGFNINLNNCLLYDDELEKYHDELEFNPVTDVFEYNNAVFVITRVKSDVSLPQFRGHSWGKERPRWVDTPPAEIEGFTVGTGFSSRLSSHSDTVIKSYENAVIGIIENMNIHLRGQQQNYQNNSGTFGSNMDSSNETGAKGELKNFYIIESWTDIKNLSVWTLAVAKRM
jgi:hypothetical protein